MTAAVHHGSSARLEGLETRRLLSWGSWVHIIGQDAAVANYPAAAGRNAVIVDLDTGVAFGHASLQGKIWTNPGEIANNHIDDDHDGLVDDINGWNYIANNNSPADDQGHGTLTAGIMVANRFVNNGNARHYAGDGLEYQGIATGARILPLKVADSAGIVPVAKVEAALQWVLANYRRYHLTAVNMSFDLSDQADCHNLDGVLAQLDNAGVILVAASGNHAYIDNNLAYPASNSHVIAVGGVEPDGSVMGLSDRGAKLALLAPGDEVPVLDRRGGVDLGGQGTSYSAPYITAAATLIKQVNPGLSTAQIVTTLQATGARVYDPATGMGFRRLNLNPAIARAIASVPPAAPIRLSATGVAPGVVQLVWRAVPGATSYNVYRSTRSGREGTVAYRSGIAKAKFADWGGVLGQRYFYRVAAVNAVARGPRSVEVSATAPSRRYHAADAGFSRWITAPTTVPASPFATRLVQWNVASASDVLDLVAPVA